MSNLESAELDVSIRVTDEITAERVVNLYNTVGSNPGTTKIVVEREDGEIFVVDCLVTSMSLNYRG